MVTRQVGTPETTIKTQTSSPSLSLGSPPNLLFTMSENTHKPAIGEVCWLEIPATDLARCQAFYKASFGWEYSKPPSSPEGNYVMFSKPGTNLTGGICLVKEENLIKPKVDEKGCGESTNRIVWRVEEVDASLKAIEAAGGKIVAGKTAIGPNMGYYGGFRDTEGNINGVWSLN